MEKSNYDSFYFSVFGKRQGFEKFYEEGFLSDGPIEVVKKYNNFIQLETDVIEYLSITGKALLSTYRIKFKGDYYIFIGQFRYATDSLGRPGFCGTAVVLKNCLVKDKDLESFINYINQLLLVAGYKTIKDIDYNIPEFPLLLEKKKSYHFNFSDYKTKLKISFDKSKANFFEKIFKDELGTTYSWVFFAPDATLEDIEFTNNGTTFSPVNYQNLLEDSDKYIDSLIDFKKEELEKLEHEVIKEKAAWVKKIKFAEEKLKNLNEKIAVSSKEILRKANIEKEKEKEISSQEAEIEKNKILLSNSQEALNKIQEECQSLEKEKIENQKVNNDLEKSIYNTEEEIKYNKIEIRDLENKIKDKRSEKRLLENDITRIIKSKNSLIDEKSRLEEDVNKLEMKIDELIEEKNSLISYLERNNQSDMLSTSTKEGKNYPENPIDQTNRSDVIDKQN